MDEQLKPCPLCGSTHIVRHKPSKRISEIVCDECGCRVGGDDTWDAQEYWNTRCSERELAEEQR